MRDSFLEFYGRHGISPVRQDISNLSRHFSRREGLYWQLGLLPACFAGKKVLEVGPGSGYNSLYTASLEPETYDLVDGNPTGIAHMEELFRQYPWMAKAKVHLSRVEDYQGRAQEYDMVICEGMLSGLHDPGGVLETLGNFVAEKGILLITTVDPVSTMAEQLRYLIGRRLIAHCRDLPEMVNVLLPVFGPHLATLAHMSRPHDDWIVDNIINPAAIGSTLSMAEAIDTLKGEFSFYGSSPRFIADWRWYKMLGDWSGEHNELALQGYWENVHSFLDYQAVFPARKAEANQTLYQLCMKVRELVRESEDGWEASIMEELGETLRDMTENHIKAFAPETLGRVLTELRQVLRLDASREELLKACRNEQFGRWFGRGTQYLSFVRYEG